MPGRDRRGDVLVVYRLDRVDRVDRSLHDLLDILRWLDRAGAETKSLTEPVDTTGSTGVFVVQILGAVAPPLRDPFHPRVFDDIPGHGTLQ